MPLLRMRGAGDDAVAADRACPFLLDDEELPVGGRAVVALTLLAHLFEVVRADLDVICAQRQIAGREIDRAPAAIRVARTELGHAVASELVFLRMATRE